MLRDIDVNSADKLKNILRGIGVWTGEASCLSSDQAGSDVEDSDFPLIYTERNWKCFHSRQSRPWKSFDCRRIPNRSGINKQRLCYCHKPFGKQNYSNVGKSEIAGI